MKISTMDFSGVSAFGDDEPETPPVVATLRTPDGPKVIRLDMLDFPTAWAVQSRGDLVHHPKCSAQPPWKMLCDCNAVPDEWKKIAARSRFLAALGSKPAPAPMPRRKVNRAHGPGITFFVREYQILAALAQGGHSTLMLGHAIGLGHTTHAFKSAHGYLNRNGWIDYQRSAWRIMPKGQAYLDAHPMEIAA